MNSEIKNLIKAYRARIIFLKGAKTRIDFCESDFTAPFTARIDEIEHVISDLQTILEGVAITNELIS